MPLRGESRRLPRSASPSARARQLTPQAVKDGSKTPHTRRQPPRRTRGVAASAGPVSWRWRRVSRWRCPAANSGAQSVEQLNSQIASAQSQAQSLGAEIDAKAAQVAAAHSAGRGRRGA